jgi:hypothetical protein
MLRKHNSKELRATKFFAAMFGMVALLSQAGLADTVYRCGEAYSTSNRCGDVAATEIKPTSIPHTTGSIHNPANDLREAQALEKQRLQAERQATQAAPIRQSTPSAPAANPPLNSVPQQETLTNKGKHKGKYARKPNNPYFTAVDPHAATQKKSTAKAVPAAATSGQ